MAQRCGHWHSRALLARRDAVHRETQRSPRARQCAPGCTSRESSCTRGPSAKAPWTGDVPSGQARSHREWASGCLVWGSRGRNLAAHEQRASSADDENVLKLASSNCCMTLKRLKNAGFDTCKEFKRSVLIISQ